MHDQAENLRRQMNRKNSLKQAITLSVVSEKGGVGKSNVAINFCLQLIRHRKKVLLFDLDFGMGNIGNLLGMHPNKTMIDMYHSRLDIHEVIEQGPGGLNYIAGGSGLNNLFKADSSMIDYFFMQYEKLIHIYDFIVFDMSAGASEEGIRFVKAADECIVVMTPEPASIIGVYGLIKYIVSRRSDMPLYVVMNRSKTERTGHTALNRFKKVVTEFLHTDIDLLGTLPEDKSVPMAVINQIPFSLYDDTSPASKAIKKLTNRYVNHA